MCRTPQIHIKFTVLQCFIIQSLRKADSPPHHLASHVMVYEQHATFKDICMSFHPICVSHVT